MLPRFLLICALGFAVLTASAEEPVYLLKRVLLADTEEKAGALPAEIGGDTTVYVQDVSPFQGADFPAVIEPFIGQPINSEVLTALGRAIADYGRKQDLYIVHVKVPNQNVTAGSLRLAVIIGRYSDLDFSGNRWFSRKLLEEKLGIKQGDEVRMSVLEDAVAWANTNPFRQVKVLVNDLKDEPGKANLIIGVKDRIPYRFAASYDNAGNEILGNNRYTGSLQFGNLWGLDHQGSYQFITTDDTSVYRAHALDYRVPLPWRHFLQVTGMFVRVNAPFAEFFTQKGESIVADLRYTVPLRTGDRPIEVYAGLDFKQSNNNLEYGGETVLPTKTHTFQATVGVSMVRRDARGAWYMGASMNLSPGGIDTRNDRFTYSETRVGSSPTYVYGTASVQRSQKLGAGWDASARVIGQVSSTNLLGNEQLTIGGPSSVRGFNTNQQAGDEGFMFSTELLAPVWEKSLDKISKKLPPLQTRFLAFYDAGQVFAKHYYALDPKRKPMASAGIGLRMGLGNNFSVSADYGWQLTHFPYPLPERSRGHIKLVLAY